MRGTVKSFLPEKAYGFIRGEDGRDYFFHLNDLVNRFEPVPLQTVYFDPTATRKGLKARSIQAGPMPTVTPVGPNHFIMTRDNYVRGYEIIRMVGTLRARANDPNVARNNLRTIAIDLGANAIINMTCTRSSEQEGCSNYNYTMHHFEGTAVVVARYQSTPNTNGNDPTTKDFHISHYKDGQISLVRPHALVFYTKLVLGWIRTATCIICLIPAILFCRLLHLKPRFMQAIDEADSAKNVLRPGAVG